MHCIRGIIGKEDLIKTFADNWIEAKPLKTETFWDEKTNNLDYKPEGEKAINIVLKGLGVYKESDKDEFESIGLGNLRCMD
ncbi:MAG: hypothetical protein GX194_15235 [Clostridium sp.]|jgi:hypothetical protein|nr:hypothetical protein [Clostridium sp.]